MSALPRKADHRQAWRCTEYGLLGGLFTYAIEQGYIVTNPAHGIRKPADGRREFRLEAEGYRTLGKDLEAAEARAEAWQAVVAIRLFALTGCRKGEILKLRLSEVDLPGRCLRLATQRLVIACGP